jgi:hypothetical protein
MLEIITLDYETTRWLRKMALDTGDKPASLIASMIRDIRVADEIADPQAQEALCHEEDQRVPKPNLRLVVNNEL